MAQSLPPSSPKPVSSETSTSDPATASFTGNLSPPAIRAPSDWTIDTSAVEINRWLKHKSSQSHQPMPGIEAPLCIMTKVAAYTSLAQKKSYLDALLDPAQKPDYEACDMLNLAVRALKGYSAGLVQSALHSARGDVAGLAEWHAVGIARVGKHYYLYSSCFDPAEYQAPTPAPRLNDQPGCANARHLFQLARCRKQDTYPPVHNQSGHAVKGCGRDVLKIWMTGSGSTDLQCLAEAGQFIENVARGNAGISPEGPSGPNAAHYSWVEVVW